MKKKYLFFASSCLILILLCTAYSYYYIRWQHIWLRYSPISDYQIQPHIDDTIRVAMIGDSWAYLHNVCGFDTIIENKLSKLTRKPVKMISKGRCGETTKEIYKLMFQYSADGTKSIIESYIDFCIISAGINDARTNMGIEQFKYHYSLLLNFLINNNIRPIVLEFPDVDIWNGNNNKPINEIFVDYIRSFMTSSPMYNYKDYRKNLYNMLIDSPYTEKIIYINACKWNGVNMSPNPSLFLSDHIHLNIKGYELLDSCIVNEIYKNMEDSLH